jgi:hypothetical protein
MEHWPASTQGVDASAPPLDELAPELLEEPPLDEPASVGPLDEPLEFDIPDELDAPEDPARPDEDPDEPARPDEDPDEPDDDPEEAPDEVESMLASREVTDVSPDPPQATTIAKTAAMDARVTFKAVDMFKPSYNCKLRVRRFPKRARLYCSIQVP